MSRVKRRMHMRIVKFLTFDDGCADTVRIGLAHDWDHLHGLDFGGAVTALTFTRSPVDFDELGEVATVVQRIANRGTVRCEAIGRDLES